MIELRIAKFGAKLFTAGLFDCIDLSEGGNAHI